MKIENIKKFTNNNNYMTSDTVFGMLFVEIIFTAIIYLLSYNRQKSIFYIVPVTIVAIIVGVCYAALGEKKSKLKNIYLFLGIIGVIASITCQIGCFLISDLEFNQKIVLALLLSIFSLIIYVSVIVITKIMISKADKVSKSSKISKFLITIAAISGVTASRILTRSYKNSLLILCFAILSFCFIFFAIYFSKYYYIVKLEKTNCDEKAI